jgi:hypothetical protein
MPAFKVAVIEKRSDVDARLADFGLTIDQFTAIANSARAWANDASPLMPLNAPGTLAYIYGVQELRAQVLGGDWTIDRASGIEAVVNRGLRVRIGYQNVDRACDTLFAPNPRSAKGSASENLCGPNLFEMMGVEPGPLTGVGQDGIPTFYVMVGEDGSVELSQPVIKNGTYFQFLERIFIYHPSEDWGEGADVPDGPVDDFDISVTLKPGV